MRYLALTALLFACADPVAPPLGSPDTPETVPVADTPFVPVSPVLRLVVTCDGASLWRVRRHNEILGGGYHLKRAPVDSVSFGALPGVSEIEWGQFETTSGNAIQVGHVETRPDGSARIEVGCR